MSTQQDSLDSTEIPRAQIKAQVSLKHTVSNFAAASIAIAIVTFVSLIAWIYLITSMSPWVFAGMGREVVLGFGITMFIGMTGSAGFALCALYYSMKLDWDKRPENKK
jgi:uncharacterized membrane protein (DUF485 family)